MVQELSPEADRRRSVIKEAVAALPMSAEKLASQLGVTGATLSRWLSGQREIPVEVVPKISKMIRAQGKRVRQIERKLKDLKT